ncbi:hypothetical protein ACFL0P_02610 [Candidatus Omnitrophota bacterium]
MSVRFKIENKKDILMVGVFILLLALLFQFAYIPKHREFKRLNREHRELRSDIEGLYDFIGGQEALENNIIKMRGELALLEEAFPYERAVSDIIKGLNEKAKLFKINVISLKPENFEIYKDHEGKELKLSDFFCKCMPLTLNVEARYQALGQFLVNLETSRAPMISIEQVNIEKDESMTPILNAEIDLTAYLLGK